MPAQNDKNHLASHKLKIHLNLLNNQGTPENIAVKFLRWLITYGRFIVVLVEIIVIGTFLARFKLDADLADLKDTITQQHLPHIKTLVSTETIIKQTQFKIATFKKIKDSNKDYPAIVKKVASLTPTTIKFRNLSVEAQDPPKPVQFKISGHSTSNNDLNFFINTLKSDPGFVDVNLSNISVEQNLIDFTITGNIK